MRALCGAHAERNFAPFPGSGLAGTRSRRNHDLAGTGSSRFPESRLSRALPSGTALAAPLGPESRFAGFLCIARSQDDHARAGSMTAELAEAADGIP